MFPLRALLATCVLLVPPLSPQLSGRCTSATPIIGYDCSIPEAIDTIDTTAVDPCPPAKDHITTVREGSLLQAEEITTVRVVNCHAHYIQNIVRCGMYSHAASPKQAITTGLQSITRDDCLKAASSGFLKLHGKVLTDIVLNTTTPATIVVAGTKTADGSCTGEDFEHLQTEYNKVVVERHYELTVSELFAQYDSSTGQLVTPDGLHAPYTSLQMHDSMRGDFYWTPLRPDESTCPLKTLFSGPIEVVTRIGTSQLPVTYAVVNARLHLFAMQMVRNVTICDTQLVQTEHPRLYLNFGTATFPSTDDPETDLIPYINSKFLYSEIRWSRKMETAAEDAVTRRCELHRQQLLHKLQLARDHPERVGAIFELPGVIGRAIGDQLFLARCRPQRYWLRQTAGCYDALPVQDAQNNSLFLLPVSRIATDTAEPVSCDGPFTPAFLINNTWIGLSPAPHKISPPRRLQPDGGAAVVFDVESAISTAGLYTSHDMRRYSKMLHFAATRTAIVNTIGRAAAGEGIPPGTLHFDNLFTPDQALRLISSGFERMWGWFGKVGTFMSSMVGIYFIFRCIQFAFKTLFNGITIAQATGCSLALLFAFWTSATHFLLRRQEKKDQQRQAPSVPLLIQAEEGRVGDKEIVTGVHQCPLQ